MADSCFKESGESTTGKRGFSAASKFTGNWMTDETNPVNDSKLPRPSRQAIKRSELRREKCISGCPSRQRKDETRSLHNISPDRRDNSNFTVEIPAPSRRSGGRPKAESPAPLLHPFNGRMNQWSDRSAINITLSTFTPLHPSNFARTGSSGERRIFVCAHLEARVRAELRVE